MECASQANAVCSGDLEKLSTRELFFLVVIESICKFKHALPFVPYEIRTVSGETYEIPHPDFILVPPTGSYVVVIDTKDPKEAPNHIRKLLIERGYAARWSATTEDPQA